MESKIYNAFAIPVGTYTYDYHSDLKESVLQIVEREKRLQRNYYTNGGNPQLSHIFGRSNSNVFAKYSDELEGFKKFCIETAKSFMIDSMGFRLQGDMLCPHSWINICNSGGKQVSHSHPNCVVSGTYFLNFNASHAKLRFSNPRNFPNIPCFGLVEGKQTPYSTGMYSPEVMEGQLLLWPSELLHGYANSMGENRITISMNFIPSIISNGGYDLKISE